jgi:asparagine synthase (glutamine-hydrolysing)
VDIATNRQQFWRQVEPANAETGQIFFGHRRLSVLDLTSAGRQPMANENGSLVIVYNGEIYNFLELRDELQGAGAHFKTQTDTEIIIKAYERWGVDCFTRFNGMWALILWDERKKALIACRDRFGVKPLYWAKAGGVWLFASEIKALRLYPGAVGSVNDQSLLRYLVTGVVNQGSETSLNGVSEVPPGGYLVLASSGLRSERYWRIPEAPDADGRPAGELREELRGLLASAVQLRMRSDVAVGTMLSGGVDSTAITALAETQKHTAGCGAERADRRQQVHHAFSACWPGWESDEQPLVEQMAEQYGLTLHRVYADATESRDLLPAVAAALDEPFESPVCLVQYQLMKAASQSGVTVVLNGHGSDEVFGGYPDLLVPSRLYDLLRQGRVLQFAWEVYSFRHAVLRGVMRLGYSYFARLGIGNRITTAFPDAKSVPTTADLGPELRNGSAFRRQSLHLFTHQTIPQWLRMEDRMSMAWSVESRLPFMDYRIVEWALRAPDDVKLRDGYGKFILREAIADLLPVDIAWRRTKVRFAVPVAQWLRGSWRTLIQETLLSGSPEILRVADRAALREAIGKWLEGDNAVLLPNQVWRCLSAEIWLRGMRTAA